MYREITDAEVEILAKPYKATVKKMVGQFVLATNEAHKLLPIDALDATDYSDEQKRVIREMFNHMSAFFNHSQMRDWDIIETIVTQ